MRMTVIGHPKLIPSTKESLMVGEVFSPLPHSLLMRLWGRIGSENWITAQVQDSAVLVAEDWVVSMVRDYAN